MINLSIKLIALDLDGTTLLDDHSSISTKTRVAIETAVAKDILVVPTSGRPYSFLPSSVTSIKGIQYVIVSNGSVIYNIKKHVPVYGKYISAENATRIMRSIPDDSFFEIWRNGKIFFSGCWESISMYPFNPRHRQVLEKLGIPVGNMAAFLEQEPDAIEKVNLPYIPSTEKLKIWDTLSQYTAYSLLDAGTGIEIMDAGVTKASGLHTLCRFLQQHNISVGLGNILAVGDSENDVEMLQSCGIGVAMGNSIAVVKQAAHHTTLRNTEDGVALAIEKYALSNI